MEERKLKIAIFGDGMLGKEVYFFFKETRDVSIYGINDIDITKDLNKLDEIICNNDLIINCAAYTNVDKAEQEKELCFSVNAEAVETLALLCLKYKKKLIHISSDFVFGSNIDKSISLKEEDGKHPVNIYGQSKLKGEEYLLTIMKENYLILRVQWTYGIYGNNFIFKIIDKIKNNEKEIIVVNDQFGRPTSTLNIVGAINQYIHGKLPDGLYNLSDKGKLLSKYDIAKYIKEQMNSNIEIKGIKTDNESGKYAVRQFNSNLDCSKIDSTGYKRFSYQQGINLYISHLNIL